MKRPCSITQRRFDERGQKPAAMYTASSRLPARQSRRQLGQKDIVPVAPRGADEVLEPAQHDTLQQATDEVRAARASRRTPAASPARAAACHATDSRTDPSLRAQTESEQVLCPLSPLETGTKSRRNRPRMFVGEWLRDAAMKNFPWQWPCSHRRAFSRCEVEPGVQHRTVSEARIRHDAARPAGIPRFQSCDFNRTFHDE